MLSASTTPLVETLWMVFEDDVQFIDVGVEYPVHKADARTLVRVLIWQLDVDLPEAALKWCCSLSD